MLKQALLKAKNDFEQLKQKAISGAIFSEKETKDFCGSVSSMSYYNNDRIENYPCCKNYKFWSLYLTYHINLAGGIKYYKLDPVKIKREILTLDDIASYESKNYMYEVEPDEVERDLQYLYSVADEWEKVIRKQNHSNELLIETSKEAVKELKGFEKLNKQNPFFLKGTKYYKEKRAIWWW